MDQSTTKIVWVIVGIFVGVPTMILASMQAYSLATAARPKLVAYERKEEVNLPTAYHDFLKQIDIPERRELTKIQSVVASSSGDRPSSVLIDAIAKFSTAPVIFSPIEPPQVAVVKLRNGGRKTATNVKVFFPVAAVAEITKDGTPGKTEATQGWVEINSLEPSTECVIRFWARQHFSETDIRAVSDDGAIDVDRWPCDQERKDSLWVWLATGIFCAVAVAAMFSIARTTARIEGKVARIQTLADLKPPQTR